jgi:hypothetical protein
MEASEERKPNLKEYRDTFGAEVEAAAALIEQNGQHYDTVAFLENHNPRRPRCTSITAGLISKEGLKCCDFMGHQLSEGMIF